MTAKLVSEYDATLDNKKRLVIRGLPPFGHFHVKVFKDPNKEEYTLKMEPRVLASLDQLSEKTLRMMDTAMENYAKGIRSKPIDTDEMRKIADALPHPRDKKSSGYAKVILSDLPDIDDQ